MKDQNRNQNSKFRFWHRNRSFDKSEYRNVDEISIKLSRDFDFDEGKK
jgi:hypothetical protein